MMCIRDSLRQPFAVFAPLVFLRLFACVRACAGALPSWCQLVLTAYSAQFNFAQRWRFLECTAFGASRTVISLQEKAEEPLRNRLAAARAQAMAALESARGQCRGPTTRGSSSSVCPGRSIAAAELRAITRTLEHSQ